MNQHNITFIGAGNMARSLIAGLIRNDYPRKRIWVSAPTNEKLQLLNTSYHVNITNDNNVAASHADVIILAVKPQQLETVTAEIKATVNERSALVVSVAAGTRLQTLAMWLGDQIPMVRCMPNTPVSVGSGASGLIANALATEEQKAIVESIFRSVGVTVWCDDERDMDTITALSGSGPAYYFFVMQALQDAAIAAGLNKDAAHLLTAQTALGAAHIALESNENLVALLKRVVSKGGTTAAALEQLEQNQVRDHLQKAFEAARKRAKSLTS